MVGLLSLSVLCFDSELAEQSSDAYFYLNKEHFSKHNREHCSKPFNTFSHLILTITNAFGHSYYLDITEDRMEAERLVHFPSLTQVVNESWDRNLGCWTLRSLTLSHLVGNFGWGFKYSDSW